MTEKKKFRFALNGKNVVVLILLVAIVAGFYMSTSNKTSESYNVQDEYDILRTKDLDLSYPETPKEVVKLYSRIVKCLYTKKLSDDKTRELVEQLRKLFDDALLQENSLEEQLGKLDKEVRGFKKAKKAIINYGVDEESLETKEVDGVDCATIVASFSIKKKKNYTRTDELFLLKKNSDGQWKIVGWQLTDSEAAPEESEESA